jgi:hypothetical protein
LLTLAAYVAYVDYCARSKQASSHFKGMVHRSAGPLWGLLRTLAEGERKALTFSKPLLQLFDPVNYSQLNEWIDQVAKSKHGKEFNIDFVSLLGLLGNVIGKVFSHWIFGVFESVTPKRFTGGRFQGLFRNLRGASQTFIHVLEYEGPQAFADSDVFVVNPKAGVALRLSPFYLWGLNRPIADEEPELYEFDSVKGDQFLFKAVQFRAERSVEEKGDLAEIWASLKQIRIHDVKVPPVESLTFQSSFF